MYLVKKDTNEKIKINFLRDNKKTSPRFKQIRIFLTEKKGIQWCV
jgi:hypothetical protein